MDREPPPDETACATWWKELPEPVRHFWMAHAGNTGQAADAWETYNLARAEIARPLSD